MQIAWLQLSSTRLSDKREEERISFPSIGQLLAGGLWGGRLLLSPPHPCGEHARVAGQCQ